MATTNKTKSRNRTVVTDIKVQLVDTNVRLRKLSEAKATLLAENVNMQNGDFIVSDTETLLLNNITTMVVISAWDPVRISLSNSSGEITDIECDGLFVMYGKFDSVEVKNTTPLSKIRVSYVFA